jgi:succinate dehydrogenase / fumarate reductase, membrane anchor subunit
MAAKNEVARFKAWGTTRHGYGDWKIQRLTSIAAIPLFVWFIASAVALAGEPYAEVRLWLAAPFNATMMILLVVTTFWHAKLGIQVVIEDYVHHEGVGIASLIALNLAVVALAAFCLVAILRVSLGS